MEFEHHKTSVDERNPESGMEVRVGYWVISLLVNWFRDLIGLLVNWFISLEGLESLEDKLRLPLLF